MKFLKIVIKWALTPERGAAGRKKKWKEVGSSENLNSYLTQIRHRNRCHFFIGSVLPVLNFHRIGYRFSKNSKNFHRFGYRFSQKKFHRFLSVFIDFLCYIKHSIWKSVVSWRENQRKKNRSENGMKRTIWRGCIQLKMNSYLLKCD